jgi:hypothetical protein
MIGMKTTARMDAQRVRSRAQRGNLRSLAHAGGYLRKTARQSIKKRPRDSAPGTPPHTRFGLLRTAILYAVDKERRSVVVGPHVQIFGRLGVPHEFGTRFRGRRYPKRPFMGPALMKSRPVLPRHWAGSVR